MFRKFTLAPNPDAPPSGGGGGAPAAAPPAQLTPVVAPKIPAAAPPPRNPDLEDDDGDDKENSKIRRVNNQNQRLKETVRASEAREAELRSALDTLAAQNKTLATERESLFQAHQQATQGLKSLNDSLANRAMDKFLGKQLEAHGIAKDSLPVVLPGVRAALGEAVVFDPKAQKVNVKNQETLSKTLLAVPGAKAPAAAPPAKQAPGAAPAPATSTPPSNVPAPRARLHNPSGVRNSAPEQTTPPPAPAPTSAALPPAEQPLTIASLAQLLSGPRGLGGGEERPLTLAELKARTRDNHVNRSKVGGGG